MSLQALHSLLLSTCTLQPCETPNIGGSAARDRYGVVYIIFVLLGTGTLLPWNVFLTEKVRIACMLVDVSNLAAQYRICVLKLDVEMFTSGPLLQFG